MMDTCVSERENEVCFIEDAYRWWHQEEKLCTSKISSLVEKLFTFKISSLVEKLFPTRMLVRKLLRWWWGILVLVRENEVCFIEYVQRGALTWHQDQKRHTWPASPGLPLMMTSKKRNSIYRLVRKLCLTVMLVIKLLYWWWWIVVLVREKWSLLHWRLSESSFDVTLRL